MSVVIVDYGMGNLRSIQRKLDREGVPVRVSDRPDEVLAAAALILPGVGHFAKGMENLNRLGLAAALHEAVVRQRVPVLGVCLGMQLFTRSSEEGNVPGLGWLDAETRRFRFAEGPSALRVPHVGWRPIAIRRQSPLLAGIAAEQRFYFTHSFHVCCRDPADVLATCQYGYEFTAAVERGHICGTQFHPEKSHYRGMRVIRNFVDGALRESGG